MMMNKYRVHEVAKDFDKPSKSVIDLLGEYFEEPKKHMTALEEKELDVIFETFTQQNEVESFDAYFAMGKPAEAEQPARPAEKEAPAAKKAPEQPAKPGTAPKQEKGAQPQSTKQGQKPQQNAAPQKKQESQNKQPQRPAQSRTKGAARTVNTRTTQVELDKYNERYEKIAPTNTRGAGDQSVQKQKLKQRSQQYRRQGMRSPRRESEAERLKRIAAERAKKPQLVIRVPEEVSVGDLAAMMKRTAAEVIKKLMALGVMATVNEIIDYDTAEIVASELGIKAEKEVVVTIEDRIIDDSADDDKDLLPRDPVVVVMGHVDHGKTSLLDAIRNTSVTEGEAGGITQHIGAYRVSIDGQDITFLDTPGHAAFTAMRARGAQATDIAVLVVAADDGIMPQTVEAINHAKAANVSIIVAINKMDRPGANPERVMQQLTEYELVPEEWGGDTICVPVSAKAHQNIDKLLEAILLVAEMKELKANSNRAAKGIVIEARLDKGRGPIATLLVQNGTLHAGDIIVAGTAVGRVRLGDAGFTHSFSMEGKTHHEFVVGTWVTVELGKDTGLDWRLIHERVMMKPSRDAMLRRESGLRRAVGFGPGWMEDGTWFALRPEGKPDVPGDAFLAALRRLSAATDKPLAVCVQGDRLHVFVTNRILGQKVSSRVPPSAAVAEVDFLPELDGILKASDALV